LSDGAQSLYPEQFEDLMVQVDTIARAIGRRLCDAPVPATAAGLSSSGAR
jgi:hypothetical protein